MIQTQVPLLCNAFIIIFQDARRLLLLFSNTFLLLNRL